MDMLVELFCEVFGISLEMSGCVLIVLGVVLDVVECYV